MLEISIFRAMMSSVLFISATPDCEGLLIRNLNFKFPLKKLKFSFLKERLFILNDSTQSMPGLELIALESFIKFFN